jgi:hypothetical protein
LRFRLRDLRILELQFYKIFKCTSLCKLGNLNTSTLKSDFESSVAELHHFYAVPAPGKNFDADPAPAPSPSPTLLDRKAKFLKRTKNFKHMLKL